MEVNALDADPAQGGAPDALTEVRAPKRTAFRADECKATWPGLRIRVYVLANVVEDVRRDGDLPLTGSTLGRPFVADASG